MKFKSLFVALMAASALFASCQEEKPVFGISADTNAIELPQGGGTAQVTVTTAQPWTVKIPTDAQAWLSADPANGTGNATITITAAANAGKDRKAGFKINAGMAGYVSITATQKGAVKPGDGLTPETAWSASEARAWIVANLADKEVTTDKYYIKGIIHKVQTTFAASGTYGNAVFFISDDGQASSEDFEAFQVYYLGGKQWKQGNPDVSVGDEVIIYGPVTLYGSTPETAGKGAAYIYSHNANGGGGQGDETDYSKAEAKTVAEFIAAANKETYYKLTGSVSGFSAQYCSFDLTDATGSIYVYSVLDNYKAEWSGKIQNGGTITIAGKYEYYDKKSQHEVVQAAILAFEAGSSSGDEPKGNGTLESPYNAAKACQVASALADKAKTETDVYVKGKISSVKYSFSADYGTATFNISDEGTTSGTQFTCYSVLYLGNAPWVEGNTQIAVGDEVIVYGKLTNYGGTYETASREAYVYSLNGKTSETAGPAFGVKSAAISVSATATEATISVTGNVAWTASSADATLSVASGEGAADIKATFAANTDTENAKTYSVKLTTAADVATKEIVVTITQAKADSGNSTVLTFQFSDVSGLSGWPSKADEAKESSTQVYSMNGVNYTFSLSPYVYTSTYNGASYLMLASKTNKGPVYLGLPALEGLSLVGVKVKTSSGASKSAQGAVTSDTSGTAVSGGAKQKLDAQSADFSWTLTGTSANTVYYYSSTESGYNSQIVELVLTYE